MNCRIINVNPNTPQEFIGEFGHSVDESGNKIRYSLRRDRIERFMNDEIEGYSISIFDAVTPKDFEIEGDKVTIGESSYRIEEKSIFYIANTLSHISIWNMDEDTLVLEDDAIFDESVFSSLRDAISDFKENSTRKDILYLQISTPWLADADTKRISHLEKVSEKISVADMDFSGTAAYFITREAKKNIMNFINSGFPLFACDKLLDVMRKNGLLRYVVPFDSGSMFSLDKETHWN